MREKALVNLEAGNLLLDAGLVDPAATRFYYSVFQAVVYALERKGRKPGDFRRGEELWGHAMVVRLAGLVRGRPEDVRLLDSLRALREAADYSPRGVVPDTLRSCIIGIPRFVSDATR